MAEINPRKFGLGLLLALIGLVALYLGVWYWTGNEDYGQSAPVVLMGIVSLVFWIQNRRQKKVSG